MTFKSLLVLSVLALVTTPVAAQSPADGGPDASKVRVKIGPLWLNPTMALTNMGIDTNVFNDPADQSPKRDFTFTFTPETALWLPMGRSWVTGDVKEDIVWYDKYASERSTNNTYALGWKIPLTRLSMAVRGVWESVRDRPGYEIDTRAQRRDTTYEGTVELRALSKTFVGVTASLFKVNFDQAAVFLGNNLRDDLNHTSTSGGITLRHQLTPLTSIAVTGTRQQDRFEFSSLRNADATSITGSVSFDPGALLKGKATVGYMDFAPLSSGIPGYKGNTASVDLSYSLFEATKFAGTIARGVQYSYDVNQPYYLQTGMTGSVSQQVFGPFDVTARAGIQQLTYRDRVGVAVLLANQVDHVHSYGGGVGYHFGKDSRLGFDVDQQMRSSMAPGRPYTGLRFGTSITYGTDAGSSASKGP